jgi:prolipoprotein diacylglyceryltransferase
VDLAFLLLGQIPVYVFPLVVGLSAVIGLLWVTLPVADLPRETQLRFKLVGEALIGALVGGRIGYVLVNWPYFQDHWFAIPQVWLGGLAWPGALAGAMIFLVLLTPSWDKIAGALNMLLPLFTSLVFGSWLASWLTGHAYGVEVEAWWGIPAQDEWGLLGIRWPVQLVGALSTLALHWGVEQAGIRKWLPIPGLAASLMLAAFSGIILGLSPFRADPAPIWQGMRLDSWSALFFLGLSTIMAAYTLVRNRYKNEQISTTKDTE